MNYIDLTHSITSETPAYPGDPVPQIQQIANLEANGFIDHSITISMHVGTHLDAPQHFVSNGVSVANIPVERFFGRGVLIDVRDMSKTIEPRALIGHAIKPGDIVLFWTGWSEYFGEPQYYETFPELSIDLAKELIELRPSMVGFDTPSPDRPPFTVHQLLLQNNLLILENLTGLEALQDAGKFSVVALPAKWDTNGGPARVVAQVNS